MTLITITHPFSLPEFRKSWGSRFSEWRQRVRMRRELLALSESDVRDPRWTRTAELEAEKTRCSAIELSAFGL